MSHYRMIFTWCCAVLAGSTVNSHPDNSMIRRPENITITIPAKAIPINDTTNFMKNGNGRRKSSRNFAGASPMIPRGVQTNSTNVTANAYKNIKYLNHSF